MHVWKRKKKLLLTRLWTVTRKVVLRGQGFLVSNIVRHWGGEGVLIVPKREYCAAGYYEYVSSLLTGSMPDDTPLWLVAERSAPPNRINGL